MGDRFRPQLGFTYWASTSWYNEVGCRNGRARSIWAQCYSTAAARGQNYPAVRFSVAGEELEVAQALAARIRGIAVVGGSVADVEQLRLPIAATSLMTLYAQHRSSLAALAGQYRAKRSAIDETLDKALANNTA